MHDAEKWVAICTGILALATFALAILTFRLELAWNKNSKEQIGVQTWLDLEARFDSKEMKRFRSELAFQIKDYSASNHGEIREHVIEFFESAGTLYNLGLLNDELAKSSFSYHATHWWAALQGYVQQERLKKIDESIFCEFERFAKEMGKGYPKIGQPALSDFLVDEINVEDHAEAESFQPIFQWSLTYRGNPVMRGPNNVQFSLTNVGATVTDVSINTHSDVKGTLGARPPSLSVFPSKAEELLQLAGPLRFPQQFEILYITSRGQRFARKFIVEEMNSLQPVALEK
jgi:hypothetical protein